MKEDHEKSSYKFLIYEDFSKNVAKKRTGQEADSLADLVAKKGKQVLAGLRVLPGKKVIRSGYKKLRKGDVVRYNGKRHGESNKIINMVFNMVTGNIEGKRK